MPHRKYILTILVATVAVSAGFVHKAAATACTDTATSSNVVSKASSAPANSVICLASGTYGQTEFNTVRSSMVTIRPGDGQTVSMLPKVYAGRYYRFEGFNAPSQLAGISVAGGARNVQFADSRVTQMSLIFIENNTDAQVLVDGVTFNGLNAGPTDYEGRLTVRGPGGDTTTPSGVKIINSNFGGGGCSDGVQIIGNAYGVEVGPGNEFSGIKQGSCSAHSDALQLYGSSHTKIVGNYFHDDDTHIMAPDGGDHEQVSNNVFIGAGYLSAVQFGHHDGTSFTHNVVKDIDVQAYVGGGDTNPNKNMIEQNNVMINSSLNSSGCVSCTKDHNLFNTSGSATGTSNIIGTPVFVGGNNPTTHDGFVLASGSPGIGKATDGSDLGVIALSGSAGDGGGENPGATYHAADLANIISHYGIRTGMNSSTGDINGDGAVNIIDISRLLADYRP